MTAGLKPKLSLGRPTLYEPEYHVEQAENLALLGLTNEELAHAFSIDDITWLRWLSRYPDLRRALARGRDIADGKVAAATFKAATGWSHDAVKIMQHEGTPIVVPYTERFPPDAKLAQLWLLNRGRSKWRMAVQQEHSGSISLEAILGQADAIRGVPAPEPAPEPVYKVIEHRPVEQPKRKNVGKAVGKPKAHTPKRKRIKPVDPDDGG